MEEGSSNLSGGSSSQELSVSPFSRSGPCGLPPAFVNIIAHKIEQKVFDAGASFCFVLDTDMPEGHRLQLVTTRSLKAYQDVFLIDHAFCFRDEHEARDVLRECEPLRRRLIDLLEISLSSPGAQLPAEEETELILTRMGPWAASYRRPSGSAVTYIMDEVGSRLQHPTDPASEEEAGSAPFACSLVIDEQTGASFTAFWPEQDVEEGEVAVCRNLPNRLGLRLAALDVLTAFEDPPIERHVPLRDLHTEIGHLRACLRDNQFTVRRVSELLGLRDELGDLLPVWELSSPHLLEGLHEHLAAAYQTSNSRTLELLIRLFLLRTPVAVERVVAELGKDVWDCLRHLGLVYPAPGAPDEVISLVQLSPVATSPTTTLHVVTDFAQTGRSAFDPVMYIGVDSLGLVAAVPRDTKVGNVLDLCAGGGVQGLAAVQVCADKVTLVELNPRAARFSRFNAVLNKCEDKVTVVVADVLMLSKLGSESLEGVLEAASFDVILANPPYIPTGGVSGGLHKYGDGGKSGEQVLEGVITLAAKTLKDPDGRLYAVANLVNLDGLPGRVRTWWGEATRPPRVSVFHGRRWSVEEYASLVAGGSKHGGDSHKYGKALFDAGVTDVSNGFIFVRPAAAVTTSEGGGGETSSPSSATSSVVKLEDELWQMLAIGQEASVKLKHELRAGME